MNNDSMIKSRIPTKIKDEATEILARYGITPSQYIRTMMFRVVQDQALPFSDLVPNQRALQAMNDLKGRTNIVSFSSVADLKEWLDSDDEED